MDEAVSLVWARLTAERRRSGRPVPVTDGLMLATAQVHAMVLVTRNISDCSDRGVALLNPWTGEKHH